MLELVIVLVVLAAVAFIAVPRIDLGGLRVVPLAESVAAEIRYTQSLAMTRSEPHTFTVGGGGYAISQGGSPVPLSSGESAGSYDSSLNVSAATITFEPRFGRPGSGAAISVSGGDGAVTVYVEQETGYVYIEE